ncbi:MAG: cobyric acid synthase [Anaerolineales bacterium]|nr:cobyric acid synthase [Anaerolineales bacterium]
MTARVLMVQGTSSSVGKSILVTALCRIFAQEGLRVAPFKAQNISLNSYVTAQGHEIGRAQVVQADAAGIPPHVDMNPILLKPEGDSRCQVVLMGHPWKSVPAEDYAGRKQILWQNVTSALSRLREQYDLVIIEGAGSPAEINLRENDIVNMAVALEADAPVLLVGDIDRGGVFASLVGTLALIADDERRLVKGFVINKFRGDVRLLQSGLDALENRTGIPVLGVIHYLHRLEIAQEDSVALDQAAASASLIKEIDIAIIRFPHISNFDDFDGLELEKGLSIRYVSDSYELGNPAAVILPGTKHTISDLKWLRAKGLDRRIQDLAFHGVAIVGICGGYQMLGTEISDPSGAESLPGERTDGLNLLPLVTEFAPIKTTVQAKASVLGGPGFLKSLAGKTITGYEIHMGQSDLLPGRARPLFQLEHRKGVDGAVDQSNRIWGAYLHGLFDNSAFRRQWLHSLGWSPLDDPTDMADIRNAAYDRLAAAVRNSLDMEKLEAIAGLS